MGAMRAIQVASLDGPQAARLVEIDEPDDAGAVIIEVHAAGVAFPDVLQTRGLYQYKPEMRTSRAVRWPGWCAARRRMPTSRPVTGSRG